MRTLDSLFRSLKSHKSFLLGALTFQFALRIFMFLFIAPQFRSIFECMNIELPPVTRLLLSAAYTPVTYPWLDTLLISCFVFGIVSTVIVFLKDKVCPLRKGFLNFYSWFSLSMLIISLIVFDSHVAANTWKTLMFIIR